MRRLGVILALAILWPAIGNAEPFAVPTEIEWSPGAERLDQHAMHQQALQLAMAMTRKFSPPGEQHIYGTNPGRDLHGKRVVVLNTTSAEVASVLAKFSTSKTIDAFTMTGSKAGKESVIVVALLWDRLAFGEKATGIPLANQGGILVTDVKSEPRPDVTTRTSVALAHELFGNVQAQLEADLANPLPVTKAARRELEMRAFREGVNFIDRVKDSPLMENADSSLRQHFTWARDREVAGLESWIRAWNCGFQQVAPSS